MAGGGTRLVRCLSLRLQCPAIESFADPERPFPAKRVKLRTQRPDEALSLSAPKHADRTRNGKSERSGYLPCLHLVEQNERILLFDGQGKGFCFARSRAPRSASKSAPFSAYSSTVSPCSEMAMPL